MGGVKIVNPGKRKLLTILTIFTVIFIIICVVYFIFQQPTKKTNTTKETKAIESQTLSDIGTVYYGLDEFYNIGMTSKQVSRLKVLFEIYSIKNKKTITEISIDKKSIKHTLSKENNVRLNILDFDLVINKNEKLKATMQYRNFHDPTLKIFDNNKQLFDSQIYEL